MTNASEELPSSSVAIATLVATKIEAAGRPAMVRMLGKLGFKERHTVVEVMI